MITGETKESEEFSRTEAEKEKFAEEESTCRGPQRGCERQGPDEILGVAGL